MKAERTRPAFSIGSVAKLSLGLYIKTFFFFTFLVVLSSCVQKTDETSNSQYLETKSGTSFEEMNNNSVENAFNPSAVVNLPMAIEVENLKFSKGSICFDFDTLPDPWFVVSETQINGEEKNKIVEIVAPSKPLNIPYFDIQLERSFERPFVTPYQDYIAVQIGWISNETEYQSFKKRLQKLQNSISNKILIADVLDIDATGKWKFQAFESSPRFHAIDFSNQALLTANMNRLSIEDPIVVETLLPDDQFFGRSLVAQGIFIHSDTQVLVRFKTSARALPYADKVFEQVNGIVSTIAFSCFGEQNAR